MRKFLIFILLIPLYCWGNEPAQTGEYLGAETSETPSWFKESFLDFSEDVAEAAEANKRVMIYFHQPGCPYCAKLVNENFKDESVKNYVQQHFDGITINMWGDREVVSIGSKTFTEKQFALALKVQYTPTLLFLNEQGKTILRLNGYYPTHKFRKALSYAGEKLETQLSFNEYLKQDKEKTTQSEGLIAEADLFLKTLSLNQFTSNKPTAIFFEQQDCEDCVVMHEKILSDKATRKLVSKFNVIQLDSDSMAMVTTPSGAIKPVKQWAKELNISYYPSVIFFDENASEVMRIEAFIKTFHFQSVFDYVFKKAYIEEPSFQRFIAARGEAIRESGFNTDIWGYKSFHNEM